MIIVYKTTQLEKQCNNTLVARKEFGAHGAKKLRKRLDDLKDIANLDEAKLVAGRCHELKGNLAGHFAVVLHDGWRLIFKPYHDPLPTKADGGIDWCRVQAICVVAVEDYHD